MIFIELNPLQITFLILAPIVAICLIVVFLVIPLRNRYIKNHFRDYCYKAIYKVAFDEDYYLINNFKFRVDSSKIAVIDHILFGNKYIYVLIDTYFDGDIMGKENDQSLIFVNRKKDQKFYTDNQYQMSKTLVSYLSKTTGIDEGMFIGIIVTNNNCKIGVESNSKQYYMIQRNKLKKLIRAIEMRNLGKINATQLDAAVKAIDGLNRNKRHENK